MCLILRTLKFLRSMLHGSRNDQMAIQRNLSSHILPGTASYNYTTVYKDAWDVAERVAPPLDELEKRTVAFVAALTIARFTTRLTPCR